MMTTNEPQPRDATPAEQETYWALAAHRNRAHLVAQDAEGHLAAFLAGYPEVAFKVVRPADIAWALSDDVEPLFDR